MTPAATAQVVQDETAGRFFKTNMNKDLFRLQDARWLGGQR